MMAATVTLRTTSNADMKTLQCFVVAFASTCEFKCWDAGIYKINKSKFPFVSCPIINKILD